MFRSTTAPFFRLLLATAILLLPLVLAELLYAAPVGDSLVSLRPVVLAPDGSAPGGRVPSSYPATLLERRGTRVLVEAAVGGARLRGWAEAETFLALDAPEETLERLFDRARLVLSQGDRPVLAIAILQEAVRRDAANADGWFLLGLAGEQLAAGARRREDGEAPASVRQAALWGVIAQPSGAGYRYDGAAFRRAIALSPPAERAQEARLHLLDRCGPRPDPATAELETLRTRERDLAEFLESFPSSPRRPELLLERARLLGAVAQRSALAGRWEEAQARRDSAIEAASEVASIASEPARRRAADRLVARLTKSFPRRLAADVTASAPQVTARFVTRGGEVFLEVRRADGREVIKPYRVANPDPASLAFDATGRRLAWDESPALGHRRTRLLDLDRAQVLSPAAAVEGEVLMASGATSATPDRYTTFLGFSPDGRTLLVVSEGFTAEGARMPRRHLLCDVDGRRAVLVERPFSAPGAVDWERLASGGDPRSSG